MRTYDPADAILYVHMAQEPAAPAQPDTAGACHRLPAGYANRSPQSRLAGPPPAHDGSARDPGARPVLVVIPGGAVDSDTAPSHAARTLHSA